MTTHYEDEDQAQRLKQWWADNWLSLVAGLGIGLAAIFGWQAWQSHGERQRAEASRLYEDLQTALTLGNTEQAAQLAGSLSTQFSDSPYASGAEFYMAREAVKAGQFDAALVHLEWVRAHGADEGLRQLATLRSARVLWAQGQIDRALDRLASLPAGTASAYAMQIEQLRGDLLLAKGERGQALAAYNKAMAALGEDEAPLRAVLQDKLDDLADAAQQS